MVIAIKNRKRPCHYEALPVESEVIEDKRGMGWNFRNRGFRAFFVQKTQNAAIARGLHRLPGFFIF
jgi:hypothetical protein